MPTPTPTLQLRGGITAAQALPGRATPLPLPARHAVLGGPLDAPPTDHEREIWLGMGCFWGAERCFWTQPGVRSTAVGYGAGFTPNPHYREVCSGRTGHAELVRVVFDPTVYAPAALLARFWTQHDPTQGMRQYNDIGPQYRSLIYAPDDDLYALALRSRAHYAEALRAAGRGPITTEIVREAAVYYAEPEHQQYLAKNPNGYCGLRGTGVQCSFEGAPPI